MRLVVTNDDGIESVGLHVLATTLAAAGHDVVVVAPDRDFSGVGASLGQITMSAHIAARPTEHDGMPGLEAWALDGPPGLCALAARMGAFGDAPEVVVSGINAGLNTGRAVLHSGTVGAALTAQNFGLSGLAVSTAVADPWQWQTAADLAVGALETLAGAPARSVLNLNVPALPAGEVKGLRWARLAPFGEVQTASAEVTDHRLRFTFRGSDHQPDLTTDQGLVAAGYATLTPLAGLAEAWSMREEPGSIDVLVDRVDTGSMAPGEPFHPSHRLPER